MNRQRFGSGMQDPLEALKAFPGMEEKSSIIAPAERLDQSRLKTDLHRVRFECMNLRPGFDPAVADITKRQLIEELAYVAEALKPLQEGDKNVDVFFPWTDRKSSVERFSRMQYRLRPGGNVEKSAWTMEMDQRGKAFEALFVRKITYNPEGTTNPLTLEERAYTKPKTG